MFRVQPAKPPGDQPDAPFRGAPPCRRDVKPHPDELDEGQNHHRHAEDQVKGRGRDGHHELRDDDDHHADDEDVAPVFAKGLARLRPWVAHDLQQVRHDDRQDDSRHRHQRIEEQRQPRDHHQRHCETDRALDETGDQRDAACRDEGPQGHELQGFLKHRHPLIGAYLLQHSGRCTAKFSTTFSCVTATKRVFLLRCICKRPKSSRKAARPVPS